MTANAYSLDSPQCAPPPRPRPNVAAAEGVGAEATVRHALRRHLLAGGTQPTETIDEFWVPRSHERADMAVIGRLLTGFEIKTERDTLRRLPRQIGAYGRVFDRCTVVVAAKHSDAAIDMLPEWWGIVQVSVNGSVTFAEMRKARPNRAVDPETLVRLLWRDEVAQALTELGAQPAPRATRSVLWRELLHLADLHQLRAVVRHALARRAGTGPATVSRFRQPLPAVGVGP